MEVLEGNGKIEERDEKTCFIIYMHIPSTSRYLLHVDIYCIIFLMHIFIILHIIHVCTYIHTVFILFKYL